MEELSEARADDGDEEAEAEAVGLLSMMKRKSVCERLSIKREKKRKYRIKMRETVACFYFKEKCCEQDPTC